MSNILFDTKNLEKIEISSFNFLASKNICEFYDFTSIETYFHETMQQLKRVHHKLTIHKNNKFVNAKTTIFTRVSSGPSLPSTYQDFNFPLLCKLEEFHRKSKDAVRSWL